MKTAMILVTLLCSLTTTNAQSIKKFKIFIANEEIAHNKFFELEQFLSQKDFYTYYNNYTITTDTTYIQQHCDSIKPFYDFLGLLSKKKQRCVDLYACHQFKYINTNRHNTYIQMESFGFYKQTNKIGYNIARQHNNRKIIRSYAVQLKKQINTFINQK